VLLATLCAACRPVRGCAESHFVLAAESRLPRWFTLPPGVVRSDVEVGLSYWVSLTPGLANDTVITVRNRQGRTLQTVTGNSCWHPETRWTPKGDGTFTPAPYPHYMIVTVNGVMEVVSHPGRNDLFAISDDQAVVTEARESVAKGECRHSP
jgi:hypothetical protein